MLLVSQPSRREMTRAIPQRERIWKYRRLKGLQWPSHAMAAVTAGRGRCLRILFEQPVGDWGGGESVQFACGYALALCQDGRANPCHAVRERIQKLDGFADWQ
jgi:hypothetical protein